MLLVVTLLWGPASILSTLPGTSMHVHLCWKGGYSRWHLICSAAWCGCTNGDNVSVWSVGSSQCEYLALLDQAVIVGSHAQLS